MFVQTVLFLAAGVYSGERLWEMEKRETEKKDGQFTLFRFREKEKKGKKEFKGKVTEV